MRDDKFIKSWARERKKGKAACIMIHCGIFIASFLAGEIIVYLITGKISFSSALGVVLGGLIEGTIGGILKWDDNEEKYKRLIGSNSGGVED
jgi:hypothetical protein